MTHGSSATLTNVLSGLSAWKSEPELYMKRSGTSPVASRVLMRLSPSEPLGTELSTLIFIVEFAALNASARPWRGLNGCVHRSGQQGQLDGSGIAADFGASGQGIVMAAARAAATAPRTRQIERTDIVTSKCGPHC